MTTLIRPVASEPLLDRSGLTEQEVGALWAFLHGDIMIGGIRQRIREHWGLCSRHAWGHAVVEIELWEQGAGARGGHQPFDVAVLYADLLEVMSYLLDHSRRSRHHALERRGKCYVCQQLDIAIDKSQPQVGYAGFHSDALRAEANRFAYTSSWLAETADQWRLHLCPQCSPGGSGLLCRQHLLDSAPDEAAGTTTAEYLAEVRTRLAVLLNSMTENGDPSTPEADASWVEALGWFHMWSFPLEFVAPSA